MMWFWHIAAVIPEENASRYYKNERGEVKGFIHPFLQRGIRFYAGALEDRMQFNSLDEAIAWVEITVRMNAS